MNRSEHLLTILSEECNEVAQRVSKALRFGLLEVEPNQKLTNADRIVQEYTDLVAVYEELFDAGIITKTIDEVDIENKKQKVRKFLDYSESLGTLTK